MANTVFKLRRSSVAGKVPNTSTLAIGELGLNLTDRIIYSSDGTNIFEIGANNRNVQVTNNIFIGNSSVNTFINSTSISIKSVIANGSSGTNGYFLTSNGSSVFWAEPGLDPIGGILPVYVQFTSNGSQTSFPISGGYVSGKISVFLNGVLLRNGIEVDVTSGTDVVISPSPANGALIDVVGPSKMYSTGVSSVVSQQFTANGTANSFTITNGYIPNNILVFLNGVKQLPNVDVSITSGNTVGFYVTPPNNFIIDVYGYETAAVLASNVITVGANLTIGTNSITIGNSTVNTQITAGDIALNGSRLFVGNSTVNTIIDNTSSSFGTNTVTIGTSSYFVSNGNLGIGTSSPTTKLDVLGVITSRGTSVGYSTLNPGDATNSGYYASFSSSGVRDVYLGYATSTTIHGVWGTSSGKPILFATNNSERMRIAGDGNVGVGVSAPRCKLNIERPIFNLVNSVSVSTSQIYLRGSDIGYGMALGSLSNANNGAQYIQTVLNETPGTLPLALNPDGGNVGVGLTNPSTKLHVTSNSNILKLQTTSSSGYCYFTFANSSADYGYIGYGGSANTLYMYNYLADNIVFGSNNAAIMYLTAAGNVGIGGSPTGKLSIIGGSLPTAGSGNGLTISSGLGATRLTTDSSNQTSFIGGFYDSNALEISQGSTSGYVSGLVIGSRSATNANVVDSVAFFTRSAERMKIDNAGNVGIGNLPFQFGSTSGLGAELSIQSNTTTNAALTIQAGLSRFFISCPFNSNVLEIGGNGGTYPTTGNNGPKITISTTGVVGVKFQPTQSSSADANVLDDYEEGTWSPAWNTTNNNMSLTYGATPFGRYTKIGRLVHITGYILTNTISSQGTGNIVITGLPFSVNEEVGLCVADGSALRNYLSSTQSMLTGYGQNTTQLRPGVVGSAGNAYGLTTGSLAASSYFLFSATYVTST